MCGVPTPHISDSRHPLELTPPPGPTTRRRAEFRGVPVETMLAVTGVASAVGAVLSLLGGMALWVRRAVTGR